MEPRDVLRAYPRAAREFAPAMALSTGVFLLGTLVGVGMAFADVNLFTLLGVQDLGDLLPDIGELNQFEVLALIFLNNTRVFTMFVVGAITAGLLPALGVGFNGLLLGYVAVVTAGQQGVLFIVVGLGPHGIIEIPALILGGAVAFRLFGRTVWRVIGPALDGRDLPDFLPPVRPGVMTRDEWYRTGLVVLTGYLALAVAALVETFVTSTLLSALFG